jgi:hypothetical protein
MVQTSSPLQQEHQTLEQGSTQVTPLTSGGNYNTVVGDEAGTAITTGDYNTAVGFSADANTTALTNSIGLQAEF